MYNKEKMIYFNEDIITPETKKPIQQVTNENDDNVYETVKYLIENLLQELHIRKKVYKHKFDNCAEYDKSIFQRIYNKLLKHGKMLNEMYEELYGEKFAKTFTQEINYEQYNAERCIMDGYDLLDDYGRIYSNLENSKHKNMFHEIMHDTQKNMALLNLVYLGEE